MGSPPFPAASLPRDKLTIYRDRFPLYRDKVPPIWGEGLADKRPHPLPTWEGKGRDPRHKPLKYKEIKIRGILYLPSFIVLQLSLVNKRTQKKIAQPIATTKEMKMSSQDVTKLDCHKAAESFAKAKREKMLSAYKALRYLPAADRRKVYSEVNKAERKEAAHKMRPEDVEWKAETSILDHVDKYRKDLYWRILRNNNLITKEVYNLANGEGNR